MGEEGVLLPPICACGCWSAAAGASPAKPARGLVDNWSSERELLLQSPWAARLGWNRTLPMGGADQQWNRSAVDAAAYDDIMKSCYCSRSELFVFV
jgi:hypothetical protein